MDSPTTCQDTSAFANITPDQMRSLRRHAELTQRLLSRAAAEAESLFAKWQAEPVPARKAGLAEQLREVLRYNAALNEFEAHRGRSIASCRFDEQLPVHFLGEEAMEYEELNRRFFSASGPQRLASVWIRAALHPGGDRILTMREVRNDWRARTVAFKEARGCYLAALTYDTDFNPNPALPDRVTVRRDGRSLQGWKNMRYDPDAGDAAMARAVADSSLGHAISRAGAYPWEYPPAEGV